MPKRPAPAVEVRGTVLPDVGNQGLLFDRRPMLAGVDEQERGGFRFLGRSVQPVGRPTIKGFQEALALACEFHESSPYWIGGLVAYGESREDWSEKLSQAMSVTKLSRKTLLNLGYIYRHSTDETRALAPTPGHLDAVVKLTAEEQRELLAQARSEELTVREIRTAMQVRRRRKVIDGQAILEGLYRVLYADPPWAYNNRGDIRSGKSSAYKRAEAHYATMTIEDLCALPVEAHATAQSVLFLWVTAPILLQNPGPREVIEAWGYEYKENFVWDKVLGNYGHYHHVTHEHLLICTRGSCLPDRPTPSPKSVITERRGDEHSGKPESVRKMIERLYDGPYLELFGREPKEGWTVFGNDARLWSQSADAFGRPVEATT